MLNQKLYQSVYFVTGLCLVGIGIVGAFLPLLPSTIFFILAAACFAKSSPRFEAWIINHPTFGPPVRDWREYGAIPRPAKIIATVSMIAGFAAFYLTVRPDLWLAAIVAAMLAACAAFVCTRPAPPAV